MPLGSDYRTCRAGKINSAREFDMLKRLLLTQGPRLLTGISVCHASYGKINTPVRVGDHLKVYLPRIIWLTFKPEFPSLTES